MKDTAFFIIQNDNGVIINKVFNSSFKFEVLTKKR